MAVLKYKDPQGNWQTLDTGSGSVSSVEITSLPYGSEPTARITAGTLYIGWPDGVPIDSVITEESDNPVTSAAIYQALQQTPGMAPVQSVNGQTGAVVLDAQDVGAYEKPATGIPASDLAAGVIPAVPVQDVQVDGQSVVDGQGVADIPLGELADRKADVIIASASGAVASFSDGADNAPVESLVVGIDPVQDLHGQDSPYPPGGGKNLLNIDAEESTPNPTDVFTSPRTMMAGKRYPGLRCDNYYYRNYVSYSVSNGVLKVTSSNNLYYGLAYIVSCNGGESYTLSATLSNCNVSIGCYDSEWNFISSILTIRATSPQTFTTPSNAAYVSVVFGSTPLGSEGTATNIQLEKGSTATTYAPYSNICPITGWTGAKVTRTGKNLFDKTTAVVGYIDDSDGTINPINLYKCTDYIPVNGGNSYYIKSEQTNGMWGAWYDKGKKYISSLIAYANVVVTAPQNAAFARLTVLTGNSGNLDTFAVNYPSTDHDYHAYNGYTYPISWQSVAGTVYGGTLDVTTGLLTVTMVEVDLGTLNWNTRAFSSNSGFTAPLSNGVPVTGGAGIANAISSQYPIVSNGTLSISGKDKIMAVGAYYQAGCNIYVLDSDYTDAATFKAAMSGVQLVYELATPITYTLTASEIRTLFGQNNIWADTGAVSVDYCADTKAYVDDAVSAVPVQDVQINGSSILNQGVANVPLADANVFGVVKVQTSRGVTISNGLLGVYQALSSYIKAGSNGYTPITPYRQHESVFYGLTKAAGADMASSSNPVGTYTDAAKVAIQKMLGIYEAPFRLIYDNTITEETGAINIISDMDSNPFLLKEILVLFDGVVGTATSHGSVIVNSSTADNNSANLTVATLYNTTAQTRSAHIQIIGGRMFGEAGNANLPNFYSTITLQHNKNASGWIECNLVNEITIRSLNSHKFTAGNIKIYGR